MYLKMKKLIYFDEFPKHQLKIQEETKTKEDLDDEAAKENEEEDPSNISYDPASASLKKVFGIINKMLAKQKAYRSKLISSDKKDVTNRDLLIKKLESITREVEFFDSEFQRLLNSEETQYKDKL